MTSAADHTANRSRPNPLLLVATPIGNLSDISPRAVTALSEAEVVACEDTRRTGRLLHHLGIRAPRLMVVNEHTEHDRTPELVELIASGHRVVLVSDAGLPGISDPGERVVRAVTEAGFEVSVVPGPSAVVAALVISGLATTRFVFEGFLPRRGADRTRRLDELISEIRTIVLFEAPHRLARTLADLTGVLGGHRRIVLVRELTKLHEQRWAGTLSEAVDRVAETEPRGEYVLVLDGAPDAPEASVEDLDAVLSRSLNAGMTTKDAATDAARHLGIPRRQAYERALILARGSGPLPSAP